MKTVIRVQDKYGRGMFQFCNTDEDSETKSVYGIKGLENLSLRHNSFPNVFSDVVINKAFDKELGFESFDSEDYKHSKWRFSFKNITQFEKWVTREEVSVLRDNGYRVFKIEVSIVVESEYQTIFDINSVTSITDITDLFIN